MPETLKEKWKRITEEENCFGDWKSVKEKKSKRPDMHALMLLDTLFPRKSDLICGAEHDCIHLDVELEEVAELTEDQIIELLRCGVRFDGESLKLFT